MKLKKRTTVDFSKHIVLETHFQNENHSLDIWDMKIPDSNYTHRIKFINSCGILTVDGDFGRWTFCREFHPSAEGYISDGCWGEKLSIGSEQTYSKYDAERTEKEIKQLIRKGLKEYGYEGDELKQLKEQLTDLLPYVDDELEYTYKAYRECDIDYELVPFCKTTHRWLEVIFDAFEELCRRERLKTK
jgi:hypothetical protein